VRLDLKMFVAGNATRGVMGINSSVDEGCKLKEFASRLPNAHPDHVEELNKILDTVNNGIKAVRRFKPKLLHYPALW
jgi:hypothetical protein